MIFKSLPLKGSYLIKLEKKEDSRGFFARLFCQAEFNKMGIDFNIVQINNSFNVQKGTLRGLHFQYQPKADERIVRCIRGSIWDVIVDLRENSPTYGKWFGEKLTQNNRTMMYVPKGFSHGFQTLSDNVEIIYFHSQYYSKDCERGLYYNDTDIDIQWPLPVTQISERDKSHPLLYNLEPIVL